MIFIQAGFSVCALPPPHSAACSLGAWGPAPCPVPSGSQLSGSWGDTCHIRFRSQGVERRAAFSILSLTAEIWKQLHPIPWVSGEGPASR